MHGARGWAARGIAFDGGNGAERLQVNPRAREDGVDCGDALCAATEGRTRGQPDVTNVGRHLRPHWAIGGTDDPAGDLFDHLGVLPHRRAHVPLGVPVRAREIALKAVDAALGDAPCKLLPALLVVLLHDGGNQHPIRVLGLQPAEVVQPILERAVRD